MRVLENISDRMSKGETVIPVTDAKKDCFQLLNDLDHVAYNVHGSLTSKKYMRNEAYSLMASEGAPSWYFTMAPSDHSHPICVHWANQKMEFDPIPLAEKERVCLVTQNPVAGARFFNFMVQLFITCVLRVGENVMQGLFRDVSAYYGTVEQQGRLTLHLHMIIWLRNCLSPQQIRDRLLSDDSEFRIQLVQYLESVHRGDYFTDPQETVNAMRHEESLHPGYYDFAEVLPVSPPSHCEKVAGCDECIAGNTSESWWTYFRQMVDMVVSKCNIHSCHSNTWADGTLKQNANAKGCLDNK